jgi:hypothetical protein
VLHADLLATLVALARTDLASFVNVSSLLPSSPLRCV